MRIGAALVLIAVGAILRFALMTVSSHGIYLHTIGDILMAVGLLGLILWMVVWAPWARRSSTYRRSRYVEDDRYPPGTYPSGNYAPGTGPAGRVHEEVRYDDH